MNNDSLLSPANIAELASVSRPVVSNWRRRYDDFPDPVGGTDARPLFSRDDVVAWLTNRNHAINTDDTAAALWASFNVLRGQLSSDEVQTLVLLLMVMRQYLPDAFEDIEEAKAEETASLLEAAEEELRAKYPVDGEAREALRTPFREHLENVDPALLAPMISAVASADMGRAAEYADELIERFSRAHGRGGGTHGSINSPASKLLIALAGDAEGTVYDPASGIAEVLINIARKRSATKLVGSDIDPGALTVASLRALLSGINVSFTLGDVLNEDPVPGLEADVIVVEPPIGLYVDTSSMLSDPRYSYGVPSRRGSELLWVQHALAHLAPGGRAYVLTSHLAMRGGKSEQNVRANLLRSGCIEAVVGLPGRMLPHTAIPLALWVLRSPDPDADSVLMIDAESVENPETVIPEWLNPPGITLPMILAPSEEVDIADIIADESILTPTRWIGTVDREPKTVKKELTSTVEALARSLQDLTGRELAVDHMVGLPKARAVTIGELIENGIIERAPGRHRAPRSAAATSIVTSADLRNQKLPDNSQAALMSLPEETVAGDVLVATTTGIQSMLDTEGGRQVATGVERLRVLDSSVLIPEYLVHALQGQWNERYRTGMTIKRIPVQDLEIPLIPIEDQKRTSTLLDQVRTLQAQAAMLIEQSSSVASAVLDTIRYDVPITEADLG